MSNCDYCWKSFLWACPLLLHHPINIISCSAFEANDAYLKEQELISKFHKRLVEGLEHLQSVEDGVTDETNNLITFEPVQEWFETEIEKWEKKK